MRRAAIVVAVLALVGCGQDDARPRAAKATPTPTTAPPHTIDVRFAAADGRRVTAQYAPAGKDAPAVVLLHEIRGGPDQWDDLAGDLHAAGFATLAYLSRPSVMERERVADTLGAIRWLRARPDVDRKRLALVGASIGASTTVYAMAAGARRTVDAAVALSPPDSSDIWNLQDHDRYRPHDMLLVSDDREAPSAESMLEGAARSEAIRSERPGHGVVLLAEPGVRRALLDWLGERVS